MLSKSLIQFSVDGQGYVPSLLFDMRQNYGGGNEDNDDLLQKVPCMHCRTQCPQSCSRPPLTHSLPETPGHSRESLGQSLVGSLLLSPGSWCLQDSACALQESISQSCVSFGSSLVGLMVTSSKRAYATPTSAAPRAPVPVAVYHPHILPQEMLKHSSVSVSVGSLGPGSQGLFEPSEHLWQECGLILNVNLLPQLSCWGFSFALGCGVSIWGGSFFVRQITICQ